MEDLVVREDIGPVAVLTMNRPERLNAFHLDIAEAIVDRLQAIIFDPTIKVCVLRGAGRAFCAGADLKHPDSHTIHSIDSTLLHITRESGEEYFGYLLDYPKPIICSVHGYAIGIGFQMQLCCDVIVAATDAIFRLPQVQLGIMPAYGGAPRLAQWVGRGIASEIALSGRDLTGTEAYRIGLASYLFEPGELFDGTMKVANQIAAASAHSLSMTKESVRNGLEEGQLRTASVGDKYRFSALSQTEHSIARHSRWRSP